MKKAASLLSLFSILLSVFVMIPMTVEGSFIPSGSNQGETHQGCNSLQKQATWEITFPCTLSQIHSGSIEIEGSGACASGTVCCDAMSFDCGRTQITTALLNLK